MATVFAGEDHHVVLGVGPDASQAQIKRAYYGLARVLHPDKNANEPEEATKLMQRVNEAFQALTPAKTCRSCEPYGSPAFQRTPGGRRGNPGVPGRFPDGGGIRVESRTLPTSFRIGPVKHHYDYRILDTNFYQCVRGSDWAQEGEVLFLVPDTKGYWVALDAPCGVTTAEDTLAIGHPVFRSCEPVLDPGPHTWESNDTPRGGQNWRATGLCCKTTVLSDNLRRV